MVGDVLGTGQSSLALRNTIRPPRAGWQSTTPSQDAGVWGPHQEGFGRQVYAYSWNPARQRSSSSGWDDDLREDFGNKVIEETLISARTSISGGKTIADPLAARGVFPKMVTHMIAVGESTGALDAMFGKIADFYEDEVDQAVASLTSLLEPMMMVFLGIVIGFIVIAMYLPIFKMSDAIG